MDSVIIEDSVTIAAASIVDNIIAANNALRPLMKVPYPCRARLVAVATITGLRLDLAHGQRKVLASSEPRVATFSEEPQDVMADEWFAEPGEVLSLRVVNTGASTPILRYRIVMEPLFPDWTPGMPYDLSQFPDQLTMQRGPVNVPNPTADLNLLDGLEFEQLPVPSLLRVLMTASATGLTRQLYIEQQRISPPSAVTISNRIPIDPFDSTIDGIEVAENDQIILQTSNNSGGALSIFWKIKLQQQVRT